MGGYYTFLGNQYRIEVEGEEYFIDLLLYHRKLRCLVALGLKVGEFKPEYAARCSFISRCSTTR
jgi:predicted nuclease of restriction endonuclease-like (RecB) superfamily